MTRGDIPQGALVFIVGPTGVGKSALAHAVAFRTQSLILNCDSVQCYQGVEIGAAKPTQAERTEVAYGLLDWVAFPDQMSIADFREAALRELSKAWGRRPVMAVGGSGFYLQALWCGLSPAPSVNLQVRQRLEARLSQEGEDALFEELQRRDPVSAARLHKHDHYRVLRALAHNLQTGTSISWPQKKERLESFGKGLPYPFHVLGLEMDRSHLKWRLRQRTRAMLAAGWVEEVRALMARGWGNWWPLKSVGYREVVACLEGRFGMSELEDHIVRATVQLAKRQMTWFRQWPQVVWFDSERQMHEAQDQIMEWLFATEE